MLCKLNVVVGVCEIVDLRTARMIADATAVIVTRFWMRLQRDGWRLKSVIRATSDSEAHSMLEASRSLALNVNLKIRSKIIIILI